MSRFSALSAQLILLSALVGGAAHAQSGSTIMQTQIKGALNEMVQEVHNAPTAGAKREVMDRFVSKIDQRVTLIEHIPFLSDDNQVALQHLQARFDSYATAIRGTSATDQAEGGVVDDSDLDAYATFMQNDLEQAQNGGIFLSTGAIVILLLILILIL
jgi:hypothetical protein